MVEDKGHMPELHGAHDQSHISKFYPRYKMLEVMWSEEGDGEGRYMSLKRSFWGSNTPAWLRNTMLKDTT